MEFYFIIFGGLFLLALMEICGLKKQDVSKLYWFCLFVFWILSFIRWEKGTDWDNYYYFFTEIQWSPNYSGTYEWGFEKINYWVGSITDNYSVLLFFIALLLYSIEGIAIKRMSVFPLVSILIFWALNYSNIFFVRQSIGIAFLMYSIRFIEQRRFGMFLLWVGLAAGFHRTCWVFLLAWWVWDIKWNIRTWYLILGGGIILSFAIAYIFQILSTVLGSVIQAKVDLYLNEEYNQSHADIMNVKMILLRGVTNKLFMLLVMHWVQQRIVSSYPQILHYMNLFFVGAILYCLTLPVSLALVRLAYPFEIIQIILIPFIFKAAKSKVSRIIVLCILSVYLGLRFWQTLNGPYSEEFIPYTTFFHN